MMNGESNQKPLSNSRTLNRTVLLCILIVLIISILICILLFTNYFPVSYNGTTSYWRLAEAVLKGIENYDATRTSWYPVSLTISGSETMVYGIQHGLGLSVTLSVFFLGLIMTRNPIFGGFSGLAHNLSAGYVLFEVNLSIESLATFFRAYFWIKKQGWWFFWRVPVYWSPGSLKDALLVNAFRFYKASKRIIFFGANLVFVIPGIAAALIKKHRNSWLSKPMLWIIAATIWATSVLQTLLDHGDNSRFLISIQSMSLIWVIWIMYHSWLGIKISHQRITK